MYECSYEMIIPLLWLMEWNGMEWNGMEWNGAVLSNGKGKRKMLDSNYFNCLIELLTMFRMLANCFKFQVKLLSNKHGFTKSFHESIMNPIRYSKAILDPTWQIHCKREMFVIKLTNGMAAANGMATAND
ncbi:hypothetical protein DERP_007768 [Dermatophagoides pteronyssinus]|uniref:Uncharacterized protein n=1 Tax=Dermatophagoides pteronyssinus TaxID=6956 RepID=A0ABQ8ISW4_DERPT|nr:hypothetical protein DERP_007768 [Dermatophagoides pteronyssinus]